MSDNPNRLRDLAATLDGCEWNHPLGSADMCRRVADELDRLQTPVYDPDITEVVGTLTRGGLSYLADHVRGLVRNRDRLRLMVVDLGEQLARQADEIDRLRALNAAWEDKATAWMASPEAAKRLAGYRKLGSQLAEKDAEIERLRADNEKLTKQVAEWVEEFANRQEVKSE